VRQVRTAALSRHSAPAFVLLGGLELMQLRKLPHLARSMFFELLALADHSTGRVRTSYAVLAALLDWDAAPTANTPGKPTLKQLRGALASLASVGLVRVDPIKNEKTKALFLRVSPRAGIGAPAEKQGREQGRPRKRDSQALARVPGPQAPEAGQTAGQGVQEKSLSPYPLLSTATGPTAEDLARMEAVRERLAGPRGGKSRAPKGA